MMPSNTTSRKTKSALVIDLETKKSFQEFGSRNKHHLLGVSVACVYDYQTDDFLSFEEQELNKLEELLGKRELIIGFNIKDFDYKVLQPYLKALNPVELNTLDLIEKVERVVGFRVSLSNLAKNTLGEEKSDHGLEALEWFRQGKIEKVKRYCLNDVRLTRDLYEYGNNHGVIRFESRFYGVKTIPAEWARNEKGAGDIKKILEEANKKRLLVEIDYISSKPKPGENARKKREIEIHSIRGNTVEAYCHLRQDKRNFKIWRIIGVKIKEGQTYTRPTLF